MKKNILFSHWPFWLLLAFFFFSLGMYIFSANRNPQTPRFFYYPDNSGLNFRGEMRRIPKQANLQADIHTYIDELLLGPINLDFSHALPGETDVKHVLVSDKTLYVDFSYGILSNDSFFHLNLETAMNNLQRNIRKNFRNIDDIFLSIEGQEVFFENK